ncbi:flagellar biosynthesis protein [Tabrizicola sp.]|uniref:flagellar biosynthesis protein n=1 Tax=Tabrizicola sp. TaxID=2005166 RepID=UPI001A498DB0|nr:flagellar biosynthesis protein [Tabrizicola sp.]MBL9074359.1 flagellar biosynthesis protein [Tabrizicola sp.]
MPALRLEVFDTAPAPDCSMRPLVEATAVEEAKVASFEQGYSAGWDDAVAAQQGDQSRIRADLARNLQSLSFTFQDARAHVLQAIRPLILQMIDRLLPEVARETLAPTVLDAVMPLAESLADAPLTLVLNPAVRAQVEDLVSQATGLPMVIDEEPTMPEGRVYIRLGTSETKVDLAQVTTDIAIAVRAFFTLQS